MMPTAETVLGFLVGFNYACAGTGLTRIGDRELTMLYYAAIVHERGLTLALSLSDQLRASGGAEDDIVGEIFEIMIELWRSVYPES